MNYKLVLLVSSAAVCIALAAVLMMSFAGKDKGNLQFEELISSFDHHWLRGDFNECREVVERLGSAAKDTRNEQLEARSLARLAFIDLEFGRWETEWDEQVETAGRLAGDEQSIAAAEVLMYGGYLKGKFLHQFEAALTDLNQAIDILSRLNDDRVLLLACHFQSRVYGFTKQEPDALEAALKSLYIARKLGNSDLLVLALEQACQSYVNIGEDKLSSELANEIVLADAGNVVAQRLLAVSGSPNSFEKNCREKIEQIKAKPEKSIFEYGQMARNLKWLAAIHEIRLEYDQALSLYDESEEYYRLALSNKDEIRIQCRKIICLLKKGDTKAAGEKFEKVVDEEKGGESNFFHQERIWVLEELGRFEAALAWFRKTEGFSSDEVGFKVSRARRAAVEFEISRARQKEFANMAKLHRTQQAVWYSVIVGLLSVGATLSVFAVIRFKGVRENKVELENLVLERTASLRQAREKAELAAQSKGDFLARVNHEIRNPLQAILGYSELLRDSNELEASGDYEEIVQGICTSSGHLMDLVQDVLDVAKLEKGALVVNNRNFSLRQLCSDIKKIVQQANDQIELELEFAFEPDLPDDFYSDPLLIRQVLINLINNSFQHADAQLVLVRFSVSSLIDSREANIAIEVKDSGVGIPADFHSQIFTPFADTPNDNIGKGLGTYISKLLVDCLGGEISFESECEMGTTFNINLPLKFAIDSVPKKNYDRRTGESLNVLVVDDKKVIRDLVCKQLQASGHRARATDTLESTLVEISQHWPEVILLDLRMPQNDGFVVLAEIRRLVGDRITVIAMTGDATKDVEENAKAKGFDDFLAKPFQVSELKAKLEQSMRGRKRALVAQANGS